jgi:hypothetical protein
MGRHRMCLHGILAGKPLEKFTNWGDTTKVEFGEKAYVECKN